ncbi:class F sortase [Arthrobacter pityocampae]|uniref:Class F sortase n=1 Tax=Arthrobacter pityocampae TaxID=547334 RepID=A0A2S5IYP5_9MICC|nr:sortase [Arthrobacter pityocampae]PPB49674.1 class F sortase [Arthrobacter pityocampae]
MIDRVTGHRWGITAPAVAALLLLTGCGGADTPAAAPMSSASPSACSSASPGAGPDAATPSTGPTTTPAPSPTPSASSPTPTATPSLPAVLPASTPVTLEIGTIGVRTDLLKLGLRENRSLEVPPDGPGAPAGWYTESPTPGERGPAVLLGHVNATDGGKGVFADLRSLETGDRMSVIREDGTTAVFEFQRGEAYGKDEFPTLEVYGNTLGSELRLITCDGYNPETGEFDDNYVVYATLVP